eukprot:CAMPEP_0202885812 /NCGR_PEP_ID=MMETSP1391-20130828/41856_1 /ASSEMBLY_ACC=CAM_ASM_000867 /TAXON_ID=1034604 /ORGANISM="Chlamydomonas leiostraca, Strain SAG 11-49" /LENGTH=161 /DNA_ID=CAMNT_0049569069 /DNA_START=77 /DNA_END=564 /DNA_ORIENTATION=-
MPEAGPTKLTCISLNPQALRAAALPARLPTCLPCRGTDWCDGPASLLAMAAGSLARSWARGGLAVGCLAGGSAICAASAAAATYNQGLHEPGKANMRHAPAASAVHAPCFWCRGTVLGMLALPHSNAGERAGRRASSRPLQVCAALVPGASHEQPANGAPA